jgi:transcription initiation factor IIE alpha subunit
MSKRTVILQIELPVELVAVLTKHGDDIVSILQIATREVRRDVRRAEIAVAAERREQKRQEREKRLRRVGRQAYRRYRRLAADIPETVKDASRTAERKEIIARIAKDLGEPREFIELALNRSREAVTGRADRRRRYFILTRALLGWTNEELAEALKLHRNTVSRMLKALRDDARARGITLFDLEQEYKTGTVK